MNDCFYEKKDWRQCKQEVSHCDPTHPRITAGSADARLMKVTARELQAVLEETAQ